MASFKFNNKSAKDLEKQIIKDINKQQARTPVLESDSGAERERKINKWIKDAGYKKR